MEITEELVLLAMCKDQDATADLYQASYDSVLNTVRFLVKDDDAAMDIAQDTFVKAFDSLAQLEDARRFRPWIKQIATNKAKDYLKRRRPVLFSELAADDSDEPLEFEDDRWVDLPENVIDRKETARLVDEIVDTLSEDQRLVVTMFYYEDMSVRQIARILGCSENTVKSRLNYARKKIEAKVLDLEKKGTKLYSLAPLPFFLWLLRGMDIGGEIPSAAMLEAVLESTAGSAGTSAGGTAAAAAGAGAKAAAGGAAKALGLKIAAGVLAVAVLGGGALAYAGAQRDKAPEAAPTAYTQPAEARETEASVPGTTQKTESPQALAETAYETVLGQYADVLTMDSQAFLDAYYNDESTFFNGDHRLLFYYHGSMGVQFHYAHYDINQDGTDELLVGAGSDGYISVVDVYGFDGQNAIQLVDEPTLGDRSQLTIHQDGTLAMIGGSGAENTAYYYWQLNGTSLTDTTPSNSEAVSDFNWQPIEANQQAPAASGNADGAYRVVLNQYLNAMEIDHQAFIDAFNSGSYGAYFAADEDAMVGYHWSALQGFGLDVLYAYYDIDHDGTNELLISSIEDGGGSYEISAVYGFNGSEAVRLLRNPVELDSRAHLYINQDGTMETTYSDMETGSLKRQVWQLNGCSLEETAPSGAEGVWEFDWQLLRAGQSSGSVGIDYYVGTFMNGNGLQATTLTIEKQGDNLARVLAEGVAADYGMETLFEATAWVEPHGLVVRFDDNGGIAIFEEADGGFRLMPEDALRDIMGFDPAVHDVFDSTYIRFEEFFP